MAKNNPPVSNGGQLYNVTDNETVVVQASQFFTDPDGDPLTFRLAAPVDVDYGKVFDNPDGTITVALNARNPYGSRSHGFLGYDVLVTDGTATMAGTIGFFVDDVYDPIVARDFTVRTAPGQPVTFNPAIYANYLDRSYTATAITDARAGVHGGTERHLRTRRRVQHAAGRADRHRHDRVRHRVYPVRR